MSKVSGDDRLQRDVIALNENVRWEILDMDQTPLVLDNVCKQLLEEANFLAAFKTRSVQSIGPVRYSEYDWFQQPIVGYYDSKKTFRVVTGLFSFQQALAHNITKVPVFVLCKAPPPNQRRRAVIGELTRILLDQQPKSGVEQLRDILCAWFKREAVKSKNPNDAAKEMAASNEASNGMAFDTNSVAAESADKKLRTPRTSDIFHSKEWQSLYPGIKNKSQFCAWQGISSKTFRDIHNDQ